MRCLVITLSPAGATVRCDETPQENSQVVLYVDGGFGRFEGHVSSKADEGAFNVEFHCTPLKRERTAEQLSSFLGNATSEPAPPLRRIERSGSRKLAFFTRADGQVVRAEVLDLSTIGVSMKSDVRPQVGEYVLIGQMAGRVARHHETGIDIEFVGNPGERPSVERVQAKLGPSR